MTEFYAEIRLVHITAVLASGALFALRGLVLNLGHGWAMAAPLRYLSYTIDTVLLTAALMLTTIIRQYRFADAWLTMKVALLVAYIGLGFAAFRSTHVRSTRLAYWLAAIAVYGFVLSVARAHDPRGIFSDLART